MIQFGIAFVAFAALVSAAPLAEEQMNSGKWVIVRHGDPFPKSIAQAMKRPLENTDKTTAKSYVAMLTYVDDGGYWGDDSTKQFKNNTLHKKMNSTFGTQDYADASYELVFGRASNVNGKVQAWFPYDSLELRSRDQMYFSLLLSETKFTWAPIKTQDESKCNRIKVLGPDNRSYSPVVLSGIAFDGFSGELLGKGDFKNREAWVSHGLKERQFSGDDFENGFVLCQTV